MSTRRTPAPPPPSSSVQKACRILQVLTDARNVRLTDIANAAAQDKATTLRLLEVMRREGLVVRDSATKLYALGPEAWLLGAAAASRHDFRPLARPSLERLAARFEDSVILSVPRGAESVCVDVKEGSFPIRANYLEIGSRRPLGAGAGSLALLAWLPDDEIAALMPSIEVALRRYPRLDRRILMQHVQRARRAGYAMMLDHVVERMGGIGVPLLGPDGRPVAAISIAALTDRITGREREIADAVTREAQLCSAARSEPRPNAHAHDAAVNPADAPR